MVEIKTGDINLGEGTVVVDFFATWCGPCKALSPILHQLSDEPGYSGIQFWKVDVDENGDFAQTYGIHSIPTLIIFKNGQEIARQVGLIPENDLRTFLNQAC